MSDHEMVSAGNGAPGRTVTKYNSEEITLIEEHLHYQTERAVRAEVECEKLQIDNERLLLKIRELENTLDEEVL